MSKYAQLRALMGSQENYNDASTNGRILKWYSDDSGATLAERKVLAGAVFEKLKNAGLQYVQKVEVRNATSTASRMTDKGIISDTIQDYDKVCVYIDKI